MKATRLLSVAVIALVLAIAGCGGDDNDNESATTTETTTSSTQGTTGQKTTPAGGATTSTVKMDEYQFQPSSATVSRGGTITVENKGKIAHNLTILKGQDKVAGTSTFLGGKTEKLKVDVKPGKYTMECTVPGHADLGMKGTVTVK
jgi:plastocyanin